VALMMVSLLGAKGSCAEARCCARSGGTTVWPLLTFHFHAQPSQLDSFESFFDAEVLEDVLPIVQVRPAIKPEL
jgi:hypothetical protein